MKMPGYKTGASDYGLTASSIQALFLTNGQARGSSLSGVPDGASLRQASPSYFPNNRKEAVASPSSHLMPAGQDINHPIPPVSFIQSMLPPQQSVPKGN